MILLLFGIKQRVQMNILEHIAAPLILVSGLSHLYLLDIQMKEALTFCLGVGQATNVLMGITMQMPLKSQICLSILGLAVVFIHFETQEKQDAKIRYYAYPLLILFNMIGAFKSCQDNLAPPIAE